jgi:hypothetical protein
MVMVPFLPAPKMTPCSLLVSNVASALFGHPSHSAAHVHRFVAVDSSNHGRTESNDDDRYDQFPDHATLPSTIAP